MGAMKDLDIQIQEVVETFEENFRLARAISDDAAENWLSRDQFNALRARRSDVYDAFYDLKAVIDGLTLNVQPEPADPVLEALKGLSAQVAKLAAATYDVNPDDDEEEVDEDSEPTGQTLEVHLGNGEVLRIPDVDEFHLEIDETNEWVVGWVWEDEADNDPNAVRKAGYWDDHGAWHTFDTRYRDPKTQGMF